MKTIKKIVLFSYLTGLGMLISSCGVAGKVYIPVPDGSGGKVHVPVAFGK